MRHRNKVKKLDRKAGPRRALLRGLVTSLILNESITTTEAKAKTIKPIVEKLITKGKAKDMNALRFLKAYLYTQKAAEKVIEVLSPKYATRPGGYTRIIKVGFAQGDGSKRAIIEFV